MSDRQECGRCGRGIPPRRHDTGFCSDRCARRQRDEDRDSAESERAHEEGETAARPEDSPHAEFLVIEAADLLAGAVARLVDLGIIDARSEAGDLLLDYASTRHGDSRPIAAVRDAALYLNARRKRHT